MMSWVLQCILGLHRPGREVVFVGKRTYDDVCYDPIKMQMTDDCRQGVRILIHMPFLDGVYVDRPEGSRGFR